MCVCLHACVRARRGLSLAVSLTGAFWVALHYDVDSSDVLLRPVLTLAGYRTVILTLKRSQPSEAWGFEHSSMRDTDGVGELVVGKVEHASAAAKCGLLTGPSRPFPMLFHFFCQCVLSMSPLPVLKDVLSIFSTPSPARKPPSRPQRSQAKSSVFTSSEPLAHLLA